MKYNGKELVEMLPENWDGKSREMIVWDGWDECTLRKLTLIGYDSVSKNWITSYPYKGWHHCAEIPNEETMETNEDTYITNNMTEDEIIEKFKTLRIELFKWLKNNDFSNLLVNNLQYSIKTALNLTDVNKHLSEVVDFSKIDTNTKKTRRMTNKELSDLIAAGKAEKCYPYYVDGRDLSKVYRTHTYYRNKEDSPCAKSILIRYNGTNEWVKPLIEE